MPPKRLRKRRRISHGSDSDVDAIHFEAKAISSDDDVQISAARTLHSSSSKRIIVVDSDSDSPLAPPPKPTPKKSKTPSIPKNKNIKDTKKNKKKAPVSKSKLVKGKRPASHSSDDSDLEPKHIIQNRFRDRGRQTEFQKKLESYNRKRHKPKGAPASSSDNADPESSESESHHEHDPLFSEASEDEASSEQGGSDFIVEDRGDVKVELPAEFRQAEDLVMSFKKIFQLFVHVAAQPADERHNFMQDRMEDEDQYFFIPLHLVRKKLAGLRDSLVTSSIWPPTFKGPLEKYPDFEIVNLEIAVRGCDACKLGSRISTRLGRVSGMPYDKYGFEDIEESDSEESDGDSEDSDSKKRRRKKRKKKPQSDIRNEFSLGRFCANRASVFHQFCHWEYDLFTGILEQVESLRHQRTVSGKRAKGLPSLSAPDAITEWLDTKDVINFHWERIRDLMDAARNLDAAGRRGGSPDDC